jgi:hypothetical protein
MLENRYIVNRHAAGARPGADPGAAERLAARPGRYHRPSKTRQHAVAQHVLPPAKGPIPRPRSRRDLFGALAALGAIAAPGIRRQAPDAVNPASAPAASDTPVAPPPPEATDTN